MLVWFLTSEVTKFSKEKPADDQISTKTWGQIGTSQLFNILLDILLADQHGHIAPDLTDRLPSCMPRVRQERAGEQECTRRIKGTLDHHSWRKTCLLKYHWSSKEILKLSPYLVRHNKLKLEEPHMPLYMHTSNLLQKMQQSWKMKIFVNHVRQIVPQSHCTHRAWFSLHTHRLMWCITIHVNWTTPDFHVWKEFSSRVSNN